MLEIHVHRFRVYLESLKVTFRVAPDPFWRARVNEENWLLELASDLPVTGGTL